MLAWLPGRIADRLPTRERDERALIDRLVHLDEGSASAQRICEIVAAGLEANAIVIEQLPNDFVVVAGAPWQPTLQTLDRLALEVCFGDADFTGSGSEFSAGSDWLFIPICRRRKVVAAVGLAGRHFRRRFDPVNDATVRAVKSALEATYAAEAASGQ